MNDVPDVGNVEPARSKIGSYQYIYGPIPEFTQSAVPLLLLQSAVIKFIYNSVFCELCAGAFNRFSMVAKYNGRSVPEKTNQFKQCIGFVFFCG